MHWLFLYVAIAVEVGATSLLKLASGFERWGVLASALALYGVSFVFLAQSLRTLPVSVAYSIWSGVGTVLVAVVGFLWFREPATAARVLFILMIVIGAIGLNLAGER